LRSAGVAVVCVLMSAILVVSLCKLFYYFQNLFSVSSLFSGLFVFLISLLGFDLKQYNIRYNMRKTGPV